MTTKVCSTCKREKDVSQFYKNKSRPGGYQYSCKTCANSQSESSRKKHIVNERLTRQARRVKNTERVREWKSQQGCKCCGETYAQCLELHHINPTEKEFNPSGGYTMSWDSFMKKAKKCVVVCANCHRKIHGGLIQLTH